jgi:hypothetical protein
VIGERRPGTAGSAWAGVVAAVAATLASGGDLLLLVVASSSTRALARGGPLREPALVVGYYLGVLAIPLYAVGYWYVGRGLPPRYGRAVVVLGTCGAVVGATIHGVTGAALHASNLGNDAVQTDDSIATLLPFAAYLVPLWALVAAALLAGSILFAIPVLRGESVYRRWMALASPGVLVAVIGACASVSIWSRALLAPASPNLAHLLFFALASTSAARRSP